MIEYNVGAWLTLGIAFKKSNPSPAANVRRTQLHSVSAVSVRAAKTAYPLSPSSFPIRRFSWGNLRFGVTGEIRYEHSYHLVRQKKMSHGKTQKPQRFPGFFTSIFQWSAFLQPKVPRPGLCRSISLPRQAVTLGAVTQEPSPVSSVILQCHHGDVIKLRLLSHKCVNLLPDIVQKLFGFR